jgi:hypothetical protein
LLAAANLLQQLGHEIPTTITAKLRHLNAICQLTTIMSGQPNAPPTYPTSPRVVPATPPRVAVAAPPRVATTSNTITAPNTIQQLPIVIMHQRLTWHNNPFQILADDEDNDDTNTVVASNCSPRMLHPTQRAQTIQPTSQCLPLCPPLFGGRLHYVQKNPTAKPTTAPASFVISMPRSCTIWSWAPPPTSPQTLLFLPPITPSVTLHDLRPHRYNTIPTHTPTVIPHYIFIEPDDDRLDRPITKSSTPPRQSIHLINTRLPGNIANTQLPGNISLQAIHHVMQLKATKLATKSQWTGHIIDIKEVCFGVIHPVTKQTITQYRKLQHDPNLKDLWVPAMSKELHRLAQGKPGITKATNTIFFLPHDEIQNIPKDQTVMYACIVIDHRPQKEDPNCIRITLGGNRINYPFELTMRTTDMVSSKLLWNSTISTPGACFAETDIKNMYLETPLDHFDPH